MRKEGKEEEKKEERKVEGGKEEGKGRGGEICRKGREENVERLEEGKRMWGEKSRRQEEGSEGARNGKSVQDKAHCM